MAHGFETVDLATVLPKIKDPTTLVVVEESPEFPGELTFQTLDDQAFLIQYRDWISRYMCLNELFMLREFHKLLKADGWKVLFGPSTARIVKGYIRWEKPLEIKGFTCPVFGDDEVGSLHPYQIFSLNRAMQSKELPQAWQRLFFAGWCAGAGKSLFACAGAQELFNQGRIDHCLVFSIMSMKPNLAYAAKASFDRTTELDWCLNDGTKATRTKRYKEAHQVYVLNYEKLWADFEALRELTKGKRVLWVFDECQKVLTDKTDARDTTKTRKALNGLVQGSEAIVWPMSASVVNHSPLRYRDVFNLAGQRNGYNILGTVTEFENRYASDIKIVPIGWNDSIKYYTWNMARLHEVRHRVAVLTQSARKTDPGVREFFKGMVTETVPIHMSAKDRKLYQWMEDKAAECLERGEKPIQEYRLLRYICNTPLALGASKDPLAQELCEVYPELITNANCAKLEYFLDQVESIAESGDKVAAFTKWTNLSLLLLAPELDKRGINYVLHYGTGQNARESQAAEHLFKTDPNITLFFSSDAGALGLNLPEARYVINYECPYAYDTLMQRSERINRADSELEGMTAYVYLTHDTLEERIWETNDGRRKLAAATLGTNEVLSYGTSTEKSEEANMAYLLFGGK